MKKFIPSVFSLLLCLVSAAQIKSPYAIYLECYTAGDTIPDGDLSNTRMPTVSLLRDGEGQSDAWVSSFPVYGYFGESALEFKQYPGSVNFEIVHGNKSLFGSEGL